MMQFNFLAIAEVVPYIIGVTFVVWIGFLLYSINQHQIAFEQLDSFRKVDALTEAQLKGFFEYNDIELEGDISESEEYFENYCKKINVDISKPVASHVKTIYQAGIYENKLEIHELIKYTSDQVLRMNPSLKGLSSIFIVLGLLGTLAGLTSSLTGLKLTMNALDKNANIVNIVSNLFSDLSKAFYPSLAGVAATILCVFILIFYSKKYCDPFRDRLASQTLNIWIPTLYPSTTHKLVETLKISEQQLRSNSEAAHEVAKFVEKVQDEFNEFGESLNSANSIVKKLSTVLANFQKGGQDFSTSVDNLATSQEELKVYFLNLNQTNSVMMQYLDSNKDTLTNLHSMISHSFQESNNRSDRLIDAFDILREINKTNTDLTEKAGNTFIEMTKMTGNIVDSLKGPLIDNLNGNFISISDNFERSIRRIEERLIGVANPMDDSAKKISGAMDVFINSFDNLSNRIDYDLRKNQENQAALINYIQASEARYQQLIDVMDKVITVSQSSAQMYQYVSSNLSDLEQRINQQELRQTLQHPFEEKNSQNKPDTERPNYIQQQDEKPQEENLQDEKQQDSGEKKDFFSRLLGKSK